MGGSSGGELCEHVVYWLQATRRFEGIYASLDD
jgi:hypothetical protein